MDGSTLPFMNTIAPNHPNTPLKSSIGTWDFEEAKKMGTLFVHELAREIAYKWTKKKIDNQKVIQIETKMPRPGNK